MSSEIRIESLRKKHSRLEEEIAAEMNRPHPDDLRLSDLKRRKLHLKEEIQSLGADAARS
ncbi:MAG: YdcH family protein [Alphaproteobacteria bacterium]|nr:YdcH family protein [Alphaproteobacteria bacterium]MDA7988821.1 YdcH family protein [Alphaproteobacteria bacterium]MDA8009503.1 YdcH family protein [Alphaproteobacteria bacterium]MDA8031301.1 YdcH family protein [Alphaproteobacteria bacterium]